MSGMYYPPNSFYGFWDNEGNIFVDDYSGRKKIGVTLNKYNQIEKIANDAVEKAEGYLKMLEEHGIIKKELTPEEKISALSGQVEQLTQLVQQLVTKNNGNREVINPEVLPPMKRGNENEFIADCGNGETYIA